MGRAHGAAASIGCMAMVGAVVVACGGPSTAPPAGPPPDRGGQVGGCGVRIFRAPACQAALDASCCPLEKECGKDAGCVTLLQCIDSCKATSSGQAQDRCSNECGKRSHFAYCEAACRGQAGDCATLCFQRGSPTEPLAKFGLIANCSKTTTYPEGVRCGDDS